MTPSQIITMVRRQSWVPTAEIPDNVMYDYLNFVYKDMRSKIVNTDKNYWRQKRTTNIVQNNNEYPLLDVIQSPASFWQLSIERVSVKYDNTQQTYRLLWNRDWDNLEASTDFFEKNQSKLNPFYILSRNSIFLFPKPLNNVSNWLLLEWIVKPYDLTSSMAESDILIDAEFHSLMALWVLAYVAQERQWLDQKNFYSSEYDKKVEDMLMDLAVRVVEPAKGNIPNFNQFTWFLWTTQF